MKLTVPLTGTNVTPEGAAATGAATAPAQTPTETQQPQARQSLHDIRMTRPAETAQPENTELIWDQFGRPKLVAKTEGEATPQEADGEAGTEADAGNDGAASDVPPLPGAHNTGQPNVSALEQQIATLTQTVELLTRAQLQGMQPPPPPKPQAPTPPDPTQFDMYDPASLAEYQRLNNAYIQATVRHEVNAALEPHGAALQDAQLNAQYNAVVGAFGNDPNFKPTMEAALKLVASFPHISIPEAYKHVASTSSPHQTAAPNAGAKPAQRTMTAQEAAQKAEQAKRLPASQGVSGAAEPGLPSVLRNVGALGRIMLHNRQSGRARPIGN